MGLLSQDWLSRSLFTRLMVATWRSLLQWTQFLTARSIDAIPPDFKP